MKKISFVIRVKNEVRDICKTIESIKKQKINGYMLEIIIVDNMSDDDTVNAVLHSVDKVIYISNEEFSWGRAINRGIANSDGQYVVLISGHCILKNENTLKDSIELMQVNSINVLYGKQVGDEEKDKMECIELIDRCPDNSILPFEKDSKGIGISNAACIFERKIWDSNKFNEILQSAEDAEWFNRIRKKGFRCGYSSKFEIQHGHYFNAEYIYKKWFWRTKIVDRMRNANLIKLLSTKSFMLIKILLITFKYYRKNRYLEKRIRIQSIFYYAIVMELPRYKARKELNKSEECKYEEIIIPKIIYDLGEKIKKYEKYTFD